MRLERHLDELLDVVVESVVSRLLLSEVQTGEMKTPAELTGPAGASVSIQGTGLNNGDSDTAAVTTAT
jgi:hypothetical protein